MIKTVGTPRITESGCDVLAFHLHRYLAHWLAKSKVERVFVTVGWEHAPMPSTTIEVGRQATRLAEVSWDFAALLRGSSVEGRAVQINDEGGRPLAFAIVETAISDPLALELEIHAAEAVRASRRNGVRMLFEEGDERDMKALLYDVLDHLPEWVGCDVAAACVLANSLEAMTVDRASEADFYVMAERLYCSDDADATRLVGLAIDTRDDVRTVVDAAIEGLAADNDRSSFRFTAHGAGYVDESGASAVSIGDVAGRPEDARSIVVPITAENHDEPELVGFLCLAYSVDLDMLPSALELLERLGPQIGHVLRTSPLYSLSAARLRLVREVRGICERLVTTDGAPDARRDAIVSEVVDLVRGSTDVPAFSVGYVLRDPRRLRYSASYGWTDFDAIDLPIDVADDAVHDSGVSALAARLGRPVVLAGGRREGDHQEFKNFLWVSEQTGEIVDARAPGRTVEGAPGWTRLGSYYKPARDGAYATLAYPITFAGDVLGVIALEVDRDTAWTWWAAYGGQLLWELVGAELAFAFWAIQRELHG